MSEREALAVEVREARSLLERLENDRRTFLREEQKKAEDVARERYGAALEAARKRVSDAIAARDEYESAEALKQATVKIDDRELPVGALMVETETDRWTRKVVRTGKVGRVEVVTKDSRFQTDFPPPIGKGIIRHLKKDGSPALRYAKWTHEWVSEAEAPKTAESARGPIVEGRP